MYSFRGKMVTVFTPIMLVYSNDRGKDGIMTILLMVWMFSIAMSELNTVVVTMTENGGACGGYDIPRLQRR